MLSHHEGLGQGVEERRDGGAVKWSKRRTQGQSIIILCSASSPSELIHAHTLRGSASDDTNNWAISCTMAVHKSCTMAMHTLQISFPSKNVTLKTFCVQGECVCNRYKGCGKISCQCSVRDQFVDKYHNIFADGFLQRKYPLILHVEIPSPKIIYTEIQTVLSYPSDCSWKQIESSTAADSVQLLSLQPKGENFYLRMHHSFSELGFV